ncbi:MAG: hypothetical protein IKY90_07400 [Oscillospiraceae bacterium]|nr:hypothetical protein [Oscillospiraceae bacterium]
MIIRGTTPDLEFELPLDTSQLAKGFVTVVQNDTVVLEKPLADCILTDNKLTVALTQEETLRLSADVCAEISLVVVTEDGERFENLPFVERVYDTAKNEVI